MTFPFLFNAHPLYLIPTHMAFVTFGRCLLFLLNTCLIAPESDFKFEGQQHNRMNAETKPKVDSCASTEVETPEAAPLVNMFAVKTSNNSDTEPSGQNLLENLSTTSNSANSETVGYQLVPYKPHPVLPVFQEEKRSFKFAEKEWTVLQQWNDVGLASVVWEAALLLSQYLEVLGKDVLKGKRIIELGAGTGLVGLVASALGAESVVVTDKTTGPAEANLKANRHNLSNKDITVAQFEWGKDPSHLKPPFDIVLAADVIYIEDTFPLLLQSLADLSDHETMILISCKRRYERDDRFFDLLHKSGRFSYNIVWRWPQEPGQPENDVKVYEVHLVSKP